MRFESFEIKNFRGIEHAKLELTPAGSGVFTLIGLNESGKTTVLEAISRFRTGVDETQSLYQAKALEDDPATFVPKHQKSSFTGRITIEARLRFAPGEKAQIILATEKSTGTKLEPSSIPDVFRITRGYIFENSDPKGRINTWHLNPTGREKGNRKDKSFGADTETWKTLVSEIRKRLPEILYFPTFLFDQPDKIVLNPGTDETPAARLYREIIQNVATSLERPLDIKTHIVDRLLNPETPIEQVFSLYSLIPSKQQQINAVLDEMSEHLTETVFDSWSKIFSSTFSGREIRLNLGVDKLQNGKAAIYLQFALKDGAQQYSISERSLGFRWFFSFLLFTLYRASGKRDTPTLFLLDEPASNLHSRAQMQLLSSFPRIANGDNQIMYSTHSHYMVEPERLDQAFIVSNSAIDYDDVNDSKSRRRHTNVNVQRYRTFVGTHPDKTTYFQPVLDKLQVIPSRLDSLKSSVLVEGKGDYLLLEYGRRVLIGSQSNYVITPTRGADGFPELVGLLLGWGVNFALCLDADRAGQRARDEFVNEWGIDKDRVFTLSDVDPELSGKRVEDLLEPEDLAIIATHYGTDAPPGKSQIQLFFSEKLALRERIPLSEKFAERIKAFDELISKALHSQRTAEYA